MSKLNTSTVIANIKKKIKLLEKKQNDYIKKYDNETIEAIKVSIEAEVSNIEIEINELTLEYQELELFGKKGVADELTKLLKKKKYAYITTDGKFLLIDNVAKTDKVVTLKESSINVHRLPAYLNNIVNRPGFFALSRNKGDNGLSEDTYIKIFQECNSSFNGRTASFNNNNWDSDYIFNTMDVQREYWCPLSSEQYNVFFDDLLYCVCGGKDENIDHLEQWLAYKFSHPERSINTPNINITGVPGGNGKGILFELLKSMFTKSGVGETTIKAMEGGFNATEEGKTVIVVDDPNEKKLPHAEIKNRTGSTSQVIERKGVDAYETDATANYIVFDNVGSIKLTGGHNGGEDRRWSIITTHLPLLSYIAKKYEMTNKESIETASFIADLAKNRIEVGKLIDHLINKHSTPAVRTLPPLHKADYIARLDDQQDQFSGIFDLLLPVVIRNGIIPNKFVNDIVNIMLDKEYKPKTIQKKFEEYLNRKGFTDILSVNNKCKITFTSTKSAITFRGRAKQIDPTRFDFDYSSISDSPYAGANTVLTRSDLVFEDDEFISQPDSPRSIFHKLNNLNENIIK